MYTTILRIQTKRAALSYSKGSYPDIERIYWYAQLGPLDAAILRNFPNLRVLSCHNCGLESLEGIEVCAQLQELYCYGNRLTSLAGIEHCPLLQKVHCANNRITTLIEAEHCPQLWFLNCADNELVSLTELNGCSQLHKLNCGRNQITSLTGIENCTQLLRLDCSGNQLETLQGVEGCLQLQRLDCRWNRIQSLEPLVYLRYLTVCEYWDNHVDDQDAQTIQVQRFLTRFAYSRFNTDYTDNTIYGNKQNVHEAHVEKSVRESVQRLLKDPRPTFSIKDIVSSGLDVKAVKLLQQYCHDCHPHSVHLLTYSELVSYVWARIDRSEHKAELIKIMGQQICDSKGMCFTGRFNRMLSVLVGFYEDIIINISDRSRISAIILTIKSKISPYDPEEHRKFARQALTEAGYNENSIKDWLRAIV